MGRTWAFRFPIYQSLAKDCCEGGHINSQTRCPCRCPWAQGSASGKESQVSGAEKKNIPKGKTEGSQGGAQSNSKGIDPSAAGPVSSAAPSPSPAAAGSHAAAGNVGYLLWCSNTAQKVCAHVDSAMGIFDNSFSIGRDSLSAC